MVGGALDLVIVIKAATDGAALWAGDVVEGIIFPTSFVRQLICPRPWDSLEGDLALEPGFTCL